MAIRLLGLGQVLISQDGHKGAHSLWAPLAGCKVSAVWDLDNTAPGRRWVSVKTIALMQMQMDHLPVVTVATQLHTARDPALRHLGEAGPPDLQDRNAAVLNQAPAPFQHSNPALQQPLAKQGLPSLTKPRGQHELGEAWDPPEASAVIHLDLHGCP